MPRWKLTVRTGPRARRSRFDSPEEALAALEAACRSAPRRQAVDLRLKTFDPIQQVAARAELAGPGVRAGVDVRGDGSAEAWTGRLRRRVVEPRPGEDAYAALRRVIASSVSAEP